MNRFICRGIIYLNQLKIEDMDDECSWKIYRTDKKLTYILYGKTFYFEILNF